MTQHGRKSDRNRKVEDLETRRREAAAKAADEPGPAAADDEGPADEAEASEAGESGTEASVEEAGSTREEVEALKEQLLRALAEIENVRRRAERERSDTARYAVSGFAREMLTVADNLRRALDNVPPEAREQDEFLEKLVTGVEMVEREMLAAFERHGIRKIEPLGEKFDHNYHQAMFEVETTEHPPGTVVELLQPGYVIHDRLLRPAMVGVARGARGDSDAAAEHVDTKV